MGFPRTFPWGIYEYVFLESRVNRSDVHVKEDQRDNIYLRLKNIKIFGTVGFVTKIRNKKIREPYWGCVGMYYDPSSRILRGGLYPAWDGNIDTERVVN